MHSSATHSEYLAKLAAERQKEAGKYGAQGGRGKKKTLGKTISQGIKEKKHEAGRVAAQAAKKIGTNRTYVAKAKKLKKEAPDQLERVFNGEANLVAVIRELAEQKREERRQENREKVSASVA